MTNYTDWVEQRRNRVVNPGPAASTGWQTFGAAPPVHTSGHMVAIANTSSVASATPRAQVTTAVGATPVVPLEPYYVRLEVKHSRGLVMELRPWFMNSDGTYIAYHRSPVSGPTTDWTPLEMSGGVPAGATLMGYQVIVRSDLAPTVNGDVFEARNITTDPGPYFDGSTPDPDTLTRYRWTGPVNASASVMETRDVIPQPFPITSTLDLHIPTSTIDLHIPTRTLEWSST